MSKAESGLRRVGFFTDMALKELDTDRGFRTPAELVELVTAIYDSPGNAQETNWVEWKRSLDLGKAAGRFAVGKAILGFANRSVEQAQLFCDGVSYMVVGVEPGSAPGVEVVDHATLGQRIRTYVDGPRWTPHYIEFGEVQVLVVVVEPPRAGDPIHTLLKTISDDRSGHHAGTVFHRGTAHTEPAGTREMTMLQARLTHGARQPELNLALDLWTSPIARLDLTDAVLDDWLGRHEQYVRANSGAPRPPETSTDAPGMNLGFNRAMTSVFWNAGQTAEDKAEYQSRVEKYLEQLRTVLPPNVINKIYNSGSNTVVFEVENETDEPISSVRCILEVPDANLVVYDSVPYLSDLPPLPKWPDRIRDSIGRYAIDPGSFSRRPLHLEHDGIAENDGNVYKYTWNVGDLRPRETAPTRAVTIVPTVNAPDELEVTMTASAMNRRGRVIRNFVVTIDSNRRTLDDFYRAHPS